VSVAWSTYRLVAPALGALAPHARWLASPHERVLWDERMGHARLAGGCHAWVHAASLGEAGAVPPLVRELERLQPRAQLVLTATTRSGRQRLQALGRPVSLAPVDTPQAVRRFFEGVQPQRLFVVETELWPHWLLRARAEGVPVAFVSARLSERSRRGYARLGGPLRALLGGVGAVLCQTEADAARWLSAGAPEHRTAVVGNLKNDSLPWAPADRAAARRDLGLDPARPLLVLGSLRPGEARLLARAWTRLPAAVRTRWQVVALPRHPHASADLRLEAMENGVRVVGQGVPLDGAWRWDDRLGVLNAWYAGADAAFVGGSLLPYGGHNPLEPAACGAAVLLGSHTASQAAAVAALERHAGVRVARDAEACAGSLAEILGDDSTRAALARAGLAAVEEERGAAQRAARRLAEWRLWPAD
jgi:3-deoxy-D-manno-octulosonic-acid transferase